MLLWTSDPDGSVPGRVPAAIASTETGLEYNFDVPFALFLSSLLARLSPAPLANARVYIVRHAEKPEEGSGLTPDGVERANAYATYFQKDPVDGTPLKLSHVFAARDSAKSFRPRLTAEPLAKSLGQKVDLRFTDKESETFVKALQTGPYGKRILIVWRHGGIPRLLKALGADPSALVPEGKWPDAVYDRVVELRYDARGRLLPGMSRTVRERLMPSDAK